MFEATPSKTKLFITAKFNRKMLPVDCFPTANGFSVAVVREVFGYLQFCEENKRQYIYPFSNRRMYFASTSWKRFSNLLSFNFSMKIFAQYALDKVLGLVLFSFDSVSRTDRQPINLHKCTCTQIHVSSRCGLLVTGGTNLRSFIRLNSH